MAFKNSSYYKDVAIHTTITNLSMLLFLNTGFIFSELGAVLPAFPKEKYLAMVILMIIASPLMGLFYYRYAYRKKYAYLIRKYAHESKIQKIVGFVMLGLYIFITVGVMVIF